MISRIISGNSTPRLGKDSRTTIFLFRDIKIEITTLAFLVVSATAIPPFRFWHRTGHSSSKASPHLLNHDPIGERLKAVTAAKPPNFNALSTTKPRPERSSIMPNMALTYQMWQANGHAPTPPKSGHEDVHAGWKAGSVRQATQGRTGPDLELKVEHVADRKALVVAESKHERPKTQPVAEKVEGAGHGKTLQALKQKSEHVVDGKVLKVDESKGERPRTQWIAGKEDPKDQTQTSLIEKSHETKVGYEKGGHG